jgi:hypothetical protein
MLSSMEASISILPIMATTAFNAIDKVCATLEDICAIERILGATSANTLAGFSLGGGGGYSELRNPTAIFVDLSGALYIADMSNYRIQKWLPNEPLGYTVAGGRGNGATLDKIGVVYGIFVDSMGSVYVSENSNHRVTLWFAWNTTAGQIVGGLIHV